MKIYFKINLKVVAGKYKSTSQGMFERGRLEVVGTTLAHLCHI